MNKLLVCAAALATITATHAVPVILTYSSQVYSAADGLIPDQGVNSFALNINSPITSITDVNIHIKISGGFNGDLGSLALFGLNDDSPYATLLDGFADPNNTTSGMDIWLDDQAAVNIYDAVGSGFLTGTFKPAGAEGLSVFNGLNPNDDIWSLLIFDNAPLAESTLVQWEVQITGDAPATPVPETMGYTGPIALLGLLSIHQLISQRGAKRTFCNHQNDSNSGVVVR